MIENTNQNITVLIAGNPDAQSGESVLLNINQSPLKSEELGKSFYEYITSDYYIELKHGTEYITYTYVMNPAKVHSQEANRPGVFWIGVTIPRGKQIENPYDLIIELRDKFQELYMTQLSDGSYEFINVPYKADVFKNIVDKYELVGLQSSYVEMTGTKMQTLSLKSDNVDGSAETKIRKFFDDTQYPELKEYSSVIVAEGIEGVSSIPIDVPRLIKYSVEEKKDDKPVEIGKISRKEPKFEYTLTKPYHKDINVIFSLDDFVSANNNTLQKEDNGSKYKVEKDKETITISVDRWVPKEKQIGVIIKDQDKLKWGNYFDSMKLTVNKDENEKNISYNKDLGWYITLIGEEIVGEIKVAQKNTNDIYNYVKTSQSNDSIIEIEVIEFNKIILSGVPCDDNEKILCLYTATAEKDYEVFIKIVTTYGGGKFDIEIAKDNRLKDLCQKNIKSYKYESKERCTNKIDINPEQYDKNEGALKIELKDIQYKSETQVSDNERAGYNKPNQQAGSDEPTTDGKYTFIVYNEIEKSVITLNKLYDNGNEKELIHDSVEIKNTKSANGNHARNYEKIDIEEELKNFSIELKLKKFNGDKSNDQKKIVADLEEKEKNIINFRIKEVVIDKGKKNTKEENNNYRRIDAQKNGDTYTFIVEEANNEGNKNNLFAWIKDLIPKILKRKADETENSKPEVEDAKTEDVANVDKPKNSKLRFVFRCLLFWLISLIIAFVFGLIVENQCDVLPLKNIFKNNTRSEKSGGRFGYSRKAAEEKEKFEKQVKEYLELLQNCTEDLNFNTVTDIKQYCGSINSINKADPRNNYISDAEEDPFNKLNNYIAVFSDVADIIKRTEFTRLSEKIPSDDDFYNELKNNLKPLLPCDGNDNDNCEEYTTFVSLIKSGTNILKIKSFVDVLGLYNEMQTQIQTQIDENKRLAIKAELEEQCNIYYNLMKNCGEDFTFKMVNDIYNWVDKNKTDSLINGNNKFNTIKDFIPHYKDAAVAINGIDTTWITSEWFESNNSEVLYYCYVRHTEYQINGFNNEFRNMIEYLLGAFKTYKAQKSDGELKLIKGGSDNTLISTVCEINHMAKNSMVEGTTYAVLDTNKYNSINNLLPKAKSIKSFRDLETIGKLNNK